MYVNIRNFGVDITVCKTVKMEILYFDSNDL